MTVFLINAGFEIALGFFLIYGEARKPEIVDHRRSIGALRRRVFCVLTITAWWFICGSRAISVGADTDAYRRTFDIFSRSNYKQAIERYTTPVGDFKDPGYVVFVKLFQTVCRDYRIYLYFMAFLFCLLLGKWIYKRSADPYLSLILYTTVFFEWFPINLIRQGTAIALVVFIGDRLIASRKFVPFLLLVLLTSTLHKSCIVFLPFYFLSRIRVNTKTTLIWIAAAFALLMFRRPAFALASTLGGYSFYDFPEDIHAPKTWLVLYGFLMGGELLYCSWHGNIRGESARYYNAMNIGFLFIPLTVYRVGFYYAIYMLLVLPDLIDRLFSKKNGRLPAAVMTAALACIMINKAANIPSLHYLFFWQE